jgi:hypothetical protein
LSRGLGEDSYLEAWSQCGVLKRESLTQTAT